MRYEYWQKAIAQFGGMEKVQDLAKKGLVQVQARFVTSIDLYQWNFVKVISWDGVARNYHSMTIKPYYIRNIRVYFKGI